MAETLRRHPVAPLIDGGRALVPIIAIADLEQAAALVVERRQPALLNLFNPDLVSLREVLREIGTVAGRRTFPGSRAPPPPRTGVARCEGRAPAPDRRRQPPRATR